MPKEVTKAEVLAAAERGEGVLGRTLDDEPIFVLCGRDHRAPGRVDAYATIAESGGHHDKANAARRVADQMRAWRIKAAADGRLAGSTSKG
jgi:hypothetical protein